jgi:hypothetical protein
MMFSVAGRCRQHSMRAETEEWRQKENNREEWVYVTKEG